MEQSPSWEANRFSASQEIACILWKWRFITAFTSTRHLSLSWASSIHSMPRHPTCWRFILILSSHLCLGLPRCLISSCFTTKTVCPPLLFPIHATWPTHLILLNFTTRKLLDKKYKSSCPHYVVFFPTFLLPRSSFNVCDKISHPYETKGKVIFMYISIFKFLNSKPQDKRFCTEW
jgi:hypothetical protein